MLKDTHKYLETKRPWLSIYGTRIRPVHPVGSVSSKLVIDSSLLHRTLPDELLFEVFIRMTPYTLGRAACVCRKWRYAILSPSLWRSACLKAWQTTGLEENEKIVSKIYGGSWRKMWLQRPRLCFDGLFVSRNTYIRAGVVEWKIVNPVHLVCYFRYIRFYPNGKFLYKNSSLKLREVAKLMDGRPSKIESIFGGRYTLANEQVQAAILYPGLRPTVLRFRLRLRGTIPGANNRLDLLSLITSGVNEIEADRVEDVLAATEGWQEDETHNLDVPAVTHGRGLAPFVFVPWEEVETSVLNLPVETMDYYVPG
ncbi:hypothetical protein O6H91_11G108600 [Diphasiastrum complanatum]|uniref:Uncharacterized protein n=1 Tax=Diphasiastrum complanatum TaxID=34168 RepID=A0ACC2CCW4_DIPCM|nr:hypothetical protein O6H91_11G108600 [Diphasiastrum complanatum]